MNNLSIAQTYMLCAVNEKGKLSTSDPEKAACLVAAGLLELKMKGFISIDGKYARTAKPLLESERHLASLYVYIANRNKVKIGALAESYTMSFSDKHFNELMMGIGESLADCGAAERIVGGLLKTKFNYLPVREMLQNVIDHLKDEFLGEAEITEECAAVVILLEKSRCLKKYFSVIEQKEMKEKRKQIMASINGKFVKSIVDYIEELLVMIYSSTIL